MATAARPHTELGQRDFRKVYPNFRLQRISILASERDTHTDGDRDGFVGERKRVMGFNLF